MNKLILLALLVVFAFSQGSGDVVVVSNEEIQSTEAAGAAAYEIKDDVYILTEDTFRNALEEFDFVLIKFFAPWCGHCKSLAPTWVEIAKALKEGNSAAKIAEVDCTIHKTVCQQKGIRGYPTMLWFQKGVDGSEKYTGARSAEAFLTWIKEKTNPTQEKLSEL